MPKIRGATLADHRAATEAALLDALATLVRERGFDAVTLAEVARTAGVGRTAIYNYYPQKEAMLLAYIEAETRRVLASMRAELIGIDDPLAQLACYARALLALPHAEFHTPGPALRDTLSEASRRRLREHVGPVEEVLRGILERAIAAGQIPTQDLDLTVALVHASLTGRTLPGEGPDREAILPSVITYVLRGVGATDTTAAHSPGARAHAGQPEAR